MYSPSANLRMLFALFILIGAGMGPSVVHAQSVERTPSLLTVKGVLTSVGASAITVQSQTGSVAAQVDDETRYIRLVVGSGADLHSGERVWLHVDFGSTVADAVAIDSTSPLPADGSPKRAPKSRRTLHPRQVLFSATAQAKSITKAHHRTSLWVFGVVAKVDGDAITLTLPHGKTAAYTLSASAAITKHMTGHWADLAPGEQVRALVAADHDAVSVTILSA